MENIALFSPVILSFLILILPSGIRYPYTLSVIILTVLVTSVPAVEVIAGGEGGPRVFATGSEPASLIFTIDSLSGFFILVTNFTVLTGLLFSDGYMKPYRPAVTRARFAIHYFSYTWLHFSMLAVLMLRDGTAFLVAWELMAVSSFMLILFEAGKRSTLKTAVSYLVQMHIGLILLIIAFLIAEPDTGIFGFDGLLAYFRHHPNMPLFFLFFAGFAIKAGFVPFHTWLPEAHPAAPSHVSGVMSGVMIKMGMYGIIRVLSVVQSDLYLTGLLIMIISVVTCLYGIIMSVMQEDLKKLLAYSTIENAGIIGTGIGLGALGQGSGDPTLMILGFGGALFHILNHSLFKSLLFYSAGSVYRATGTRNIESLGGLIRGMPVTAGLFLSGSVAICALPPLNGFVSEILLYYGLLAGLKTGSVFQALSLMLTIVALSLAGGIAIFGFSKAFGLTFLGSPRSGIHPDTRAVTPAMIVPQMIILAVILFTGIFPMLFIHPIAKISGTLFHADPFPVIAPVAGALSKISLVGVILILLTGAGLLLRQRKLKQNGQTTGPTWGCGYPYATARQQYTAASWSAGFSQLAGPVLKISDGTQEIHPEEIFPAKKTFGVVTGDFFRSAFNRVTGYAILALKKIARLQTGNIQHYILYAFVFMLIIFILLYMRVL